MSDTIDTCICSSCGKPLKSIDEARAICASCELENLLCNSCEYTRCMVCGGRMFLGNEYKLIKLEQAIWNFTSVFGLFRIDQDPIEPLSKGTSVFLDTGKTCLAITAGHMIVELSRLGEKYGEDAVSIGLVAKGEVILTVDSRQVIDWISKDGYDLATIAVPRMYIIDYLGCEVLSPMSWPPSDACQDDLVFTIGYAAGIQEWEPGRAKIRSSSMLGRVVSVSENNFVITPENGHSKVTFFTDGLRIPEHAGGMSGSPVFRLPTNGSIEEAELIGFTREAPREGWDVLLANHANLVYPDGLIRKEPR